MVYWIFHAIKNGGVVQQLRPQLYATDYSITRAIGHASQSKTCDERKHPTKSNEVDTKPVRPFGDIPTAQKWPLIGNRLDLLMASWRNDFHEYIDRRHKQLGPIFRESLGPAEAVFIMAPDAIRELFLYEGKHPMHPLPEAWNLYNRVHNCKRGLFFMDGEEWLETRRALMPLLFRNDRRFYATVETTTDELIAQWMTHSVSRSNDFALIDNLLTQLYRWSIHIIIGVMFGNAAGQIISGQRELIEHLAHSVHAVFDSSAPLVAIPPQIARKLHLKYWRTFERNVTDSLTTANRVIEYGIRLGKSDSDGLLRDMQKIGFTEEWIKRIFIDLILAAGDTTAFTTQWAFYALSQDATIQQDIRREVNETRTTPFETPLVKGCVREAMRLYPVATFVGRILDTDAVLNNYKLHKYTLVLISMYSAGRDALSFSHANEFMPARWLRDSVSGHLCGVQWPQSSLPYALGARNCIGQKIANMQMHMIIAKVVQNFELKLFNDKEIRPIMRLVVVPSEKLKLGIRKLK